MKKRILSLLIISTLLFGFLAVPVSAVADQSKTSTGANTKAMGKVGYTLYYDNSETKFSTVNIYLWNVDDYGTPIYEAKSWPGEPMTNLGNDIWSYTLKNEYYWVIFTDPSGSEGNLQTDDLVIPGDGYLAKGHYTDSFVGKMWNNITIATLWSEYGGSDHNSFDLLSDANSFYHDNDASTDNSGFVGRTNLQFSKEYQKKLWLRTNKGEKNLIKRHLNDSWGGSCYGISATMAKLYNGYISLSDLTNNKKAKSYYTIGYPCNDAKFDNMIQYYQMSQHTRYSSDKELIRTNRSDSAPKGTSADIKAFLQTLVQVANENKAYLLNFFFSGGGHSILILSSKYDELNKQYRVTLYDCNSVDRFQPYGSFTRMYVKDDFSSFTAEGSSSGWLRNYHSMLIEDANNFVLDSDSVFTKRETIAKTGADNEDICYLDIDPDTSFTVTNGKGKALSYDAENNEFSGNLEVIDLSYTGLSLEGTAMRLMLKNDTYTISGTENIDVSLMDNDEFIALEAEGIDSAELSLNNGIDIEGDGYNFNAYISTDEVINEYGETNLVEVSGNAVGNASFTADGSSIIVDSENKLSDVKVTNYQDNRFYSESIGDITGTTDISPVLPVVGDVDGDGIITVVDATYIQRYILKSIDFSDKQKAVSDTDADDIITVADATRIQRLIILLIDKLGI